MGRTAHARVAATAGAMALVLLMAGCRSSEELPAQATAAAATAKVAAAAKTIAAWPMAPVPPVADALRKGGWRGGPDPVSGKLRSGIATYYRLDPAQPKAGQIVQVDLRFEDVVGSDATVKLTVGDGAQWATVTTTTNTTDAAWRLPQNNPSQVTVRIAVPAGDSYLHVMTAQNNRPSVTSILLSAL